MHITHTMQLIHIITEALLGPLRQVGAATTDQWAGFFGTLLLWLVAAAAVYWLLFRVLRVFTGRTNNTMDNTVLRSVRVPLVVSIAAFGLVSALDRLNLDPAISVAVNRVYWVVLVVTSTLLCWRILREVVIRWLKVKAAETDSHVDDVLVPLLTTMGPLLLFIVATIFVLQALGINVGLLAASVGAAGLIVGLAFQDTLSNLFSGIYLLVDPPFQQNELIILPDGKIYNVQRVGLRMTQLYDMSNHALIYTPNNILTKSSIANITKPTVDMKVTLQVRASYDTDPARVKSLLKDILQSHRNILGEPGEKLAVLRRRIEQIILPAGASSTLVNGLMNSLQEWNDGGPMTKR